MHTRLIILVIFVMVIGIMFFIAKACTDEYEQCYKEQEYKGIAAFGNCCGLADGTKWTDGVAEFCINCPHLCFTSTGPVKGESDENEKRS